MTMSSSSIREQIAHILQDGKLYEVRALHVPTDKGARRFTGVFDNLDALAEGAAEMDRRGAYGVYFTPNPLNPALVQITNEMEPATRGGAISDSQVLQPEWFLVDIDPDRPTGVSATKDEKDQAAKLAVAVRKFLDGRGWPAPILADSGNGYHLLYRAPGLDPAMNRRCLQALDMLFSGYFAAKVDTAVHNPSRIFKVYGTWARKGTSTDERPHRRASIVEAPGSSETPLEAFTALAALVPDKKHGTDQKAPVGALDAWIAKHFGDNIVGPKPWDNGGRKWQFKVCPWDADHTDGSAYIVQFRNNGVVAGCHHESCEGAKTNAKGVQLGWKLLQAQVGDPFMGNQDHRAVLSGSSLDAPNLTDLGNAKRLVKAYVGDVIYVAEWGGWLFYDGRRWRQDVGEVEITRRAKTMAQGVYAAASIETDEKFASVLKAHARSMESAKGIGNMIRLARTEPQIAVYADRLDSDPWALNLRNGTLDLRTGKFKRHDRSDYHTKMSQVEYDPDVECPLWDEFLHTAMLEDESTVEFIHRYFGYCLTGSVAEQVFLFMEGKGGDGKTTLTNVLSYIMGEYAIAAAPGLLVAKKSDAHPTEQADLRGVRLAVAGEVEKGSAFAEAQIKYLTGSEKIRARKMRQDFEEFDPTHKFVLSANYRPRIKGSDEGIWRRVLRLYWARSIPAEERDPFFEDKLKAEAPGILNRLVEGCLQWQRVGLQPPEAVRMASQEYREEMDELGEFLDDCCVLGVSEVVPKRELYATYKSWMEDLGNRPLSYRAFGQKMSENGYPTQPRKITHGGKTKSARCCIGLSLRRDNVVQMNIRTGRGR